jgi:ABC-type amino acid transport substrate-binding protein
MSRLANDPRSSTQLDSAAKSQAASRKLNATQLKKLTALIKSYLGTSAELAKAAKLAPSTISMILSGARAPSVKVIIQLAKVLCPAEQPLEDFTGEMLELVGYERTARAHGGITETISERVQRTGRVRAAYVLADPFVDLHEGGFAAELFGYVADLMKAKIDRVDCNIGELREVLESGRADIAVSGVFPTFERRTYMSFSKPFPYLRVPLSALIRKGTSIEAGRPLTVEHVLNWGKLDTGLGKIKILLVEGEVGHDFVKTFLKKVKPREYELIRTLAPEELYRRISNDPSPDLLFLADMATCAAVHGLDKAKDDILPLPDTSPVAEHIQDVLLHSQSPKFPVLALYPITFGLPKDDEEWNKTIDTALDSLLSEGARILLSLYQRYSERERFMDFCIKDDELVSSKPLQEMFKYLARQSDMKAEATKSRKR